MEQLENNKLYQSLNQAMKKPELLLGVKKLWALDNYIAGYLAACVENNDCFTLQWYELFCEYVSETYAPKKKTHDICAIIRNLGYDEDDGVDFYMNLLDRFVKDYCGSANKQTKPSTIQLGEIRAFRVDTRKITELIGNYMREHSDEFFGVSQTDEKNVYVFVQLEDGTLVCALCDDTASAAKLSPNDTYLSERLQILPVFSQGDKIYYMRLFEQ